MKTPVGESSVGSQARLSKRASSPVECFACQWAGLEEVVLERRTRSVGPGGGEHCARDPVAVMAGEELGDSATHRIADDDCLFDAESVEDGDGIVDGVSKPETACGANASAVAALVERHDVKALGERSVNTAPVERRGHRPAMEQQYRWRARRALDGTKMGRSPVGQVEISPGREFRATDVWIGRNEPCRRGEPGHHRQSRAEAAVTCRRRVALSRWQAP